MQEIITDKCSKGHKIVELCGNPYGNGSAICAHCMKEFSNQNESFLHCPLCGTEDDKCLKCHKNSKISITEKAIIHAKPVEIDGMGYAKFINVDPFKPMDQDKVKDYLFKTYGFEPK